MDTLVTYFEADRDIDSSVMFAGEQSSISWYWLALDHYMFKVGVTNIEAVKRDSSKNKDNYSSIYLLIT